MDNARTAATYIATLYQTELTNNVRNKKLHFVQLAGNGRSLLSRNASIILNIAPRPASINLRKTLDTAGQCSITDLVKQSEKRSCKLLLHKYDTEKQLRKIYPDVSESHATLPLIFGQN
ncbi:hypothetical protein D917_03434 [Trichinella nativa]|uniref:Uncharacterized protein n=1 Tax=Trichinella nativa TaxID=6335 RepID=A0A1Y3E9I2_9BILA|nr:hypothetical protein D917_03434 [Trichinella nativa]